jgi:hypothetical protein
MLTLFHPSVSALALFQSTQLSLFERFLTQAVSGIDSTSITSGMQKVAYIVLLIGFLWQIYQSAMHGGDVRGLGTNLVKYVATAIVVMNYHAVFTTINQGFVNAGNWINSASGTTNLLQNWGNDLQTQFNQVGFQKLWDLISAGVAGFLDAILIIVAYILYPVVIVIFGFFYILYGSILYIFGPIVIALMPLGATNRLAKSYVENVFIWNAWPVLYGGFGALLSAVQMGQIGQMLNQNDFLGGLGNVEGSILIGLASIIYSLAIAVIPFIAKRIVSGDVGATAGTLIGAAATALTAGIAGAEGVTAGVASSTGASSGAQGSTANSGGVGPTAIGSGNQPAPAQRTSAVAPSSQPAAGAIPQSPSSMSSSGTQGEGLADGIRSSFSEALGGSSQRTQADADVGSGYVADEEQGGSEFHSTPTQTTSAIASPQSSPKRGSSSSRGPTPALMRPHGLSTWGAYHAARLATKGVMGGAGAATGIAQGAVRGFTNPVETAGDVGAKAGELAGRAVNASERVATTASKVASTLAHPGDTVRAGVDAVSIAAATVTSSVRQAARAASAKFTDAYERTRSDQGDSND